MEIVGRNYDLNFDAGVYDFDVHMEVQMQKIGEYLVPHVLRYNGNWFLFTKKENVVFLRLPCLILRRVSSQELGVGRFAY